MSGSKDWNDLDAGGDIGKPSKRSARPDLQERMRRRFQNRHQESSSENTSPVPFEEMGTFRQVPEGAAAAASVLCEPKRKQTGPVGKADLESNNQDANGNFLDPDIRNSDSDKSKKSQGRKLQDKADGQDHLDKALNSVIGELDRDDMSRKGKKNQSGSETVFQNNFDDLESPQGFNIQAGSENTRRGYGRRVDKEGDAVMEDKQEQQSAQDPFQEMLRSLLGEDQNVDEGGDPFAAFFGRLPCGNGNNRGVGGLFYGGENPFAALMGDRGNDGNDNENPMAALLGGGGRDPFGNLMERGSAIARKNKQNFENDLFSSFTGDLSRQRGQNSHASGRANKQEGYIANSQDESSSGDEEGEEDDSSGEKNALGTTQEKDPIRAMIDEMTKDMKKSASKLGGASGAKLEPRDSGKMGDVKGAGRGDVRGMMAAGKEEGEFGENPLEALMGGMGGGEVEADRNQLAALMGSAGKGLGSGDSGGNPLAALIGGAEGENKGSELNGNPQAAFMGRVCNDGDVESNRNPLAALMGGAERGGADLCRTCGIEVGGDPLAALMDGKGTRGGDDLSSGNPFAGLMCRTGRGGGGDVSSGNPMAALIGGGGNPFAGLMGGAGRGGGGDISSSNPMAALIGGGGNAFGGLLGGAGRGGGGGISSGNPMAALMGGGGNAFGDLMGGAGRGGGGGISSGNPMAALMGGGGNAFGGLMGGAGRGGGGDISGGNPMAALMGGGGNAFAGLMGAAGRGRGGSNGDSIGTLLNGRGGATGYSLGGQSGGDISNGNDLGGLSGMFGKGGGGGDQMSQAVAAMVGGAGRGSGGDNSMMSLMSSFGGGDGGPDGPQQQLLRQVMGQTGVPEENELTPENARDNDIIQQLLAYESMRAQSSHAPRAENAMNTVIVVDTSGSMDGQPLIEAGQFISQFINGLEELQFEYNLQENVALVCVGGETQVVQHFTNDYSLIRQATDSLSASGSSRLHLGLLLPVAVLNTGSPDERNTGGMYNVNGHLAAPRVIFISDGFPNLSDDVPTQQPRPDDKMTLILQNACIELTQTVVERTLCKVYCVPVGNCNLNFMEMLSSSSGGRVIQSTDARHMSHCILHHNLVAKLQESSMKEPTREAVAKLLKQVTATADEDDINGVFEVIREGEPDIQARDACVAQEMMQARGQGGGMRGMQGLALMGQGSGRIPGASQTMMGMSAGSGRGQGIPSSMNRARLRGSIPIISEEGYGRGSSGIQAMLGMGVNRGQLGRQGNEMDSLMGLIGGGGGLESLMGIGRGRVGGDGGGFEGLPGISQGGSGNPENGLEALLNMSRGRRDQGDGDGLGLVGQDGDGGGFGSSQKLPNGNGSLNPMLGMGRKQDGKGELGNRGENQSRNDPLSKKGNGAQGIQKVLGMGGDDYQNAHQNDGSGQLLSSGQQVMLGRRNQNQSCEIDRMRQEIAIHQQRLGKGNNEEENGQEKSLFSHLPGGSLQAMLGMGDPAENVPNKKERNTEKGNERKKSEKHQSEKHAKKVVNVELQAKNRDSSPGQFPSNEDNSEQEEKNENGQAAKSCHLGLISGDGPQVVDGAEAAAKKQSKVREKKKRRKSSKPRGNTDIGNSDGLRNVPFRPNQRGCGLFNNCPPMSFGVDRHGEAQYIDLMGDLGGNEKEGEDLMEKLSKLLEISDIGKADEIPDGDNNIGIDNPVDRDGFLRGIPDILGLGGRRARGIPGLLGNRGNQPQNIHEGPSPPNIRDFLQNMGRESMGQIIGDARDEDGDVIMEGGIGQQQGGAPFAGLGGIGGANLPYGINRAQQGAPVPQDNQGLPSVDQMLARLGMGGMGNLPGGQNPFGGQSGQGQ